MASVRLDRICRRIIRADIPNQTKKSRRQRCFPELPARHRCVRTRRLVTPPFSLGPVIFISVFSARFSSSPCFYPRCLHCADNIAYYGNYAGNTVNFQSVTESSSTGELPTYGLFGAPITPIIGDVLPFGPPTFSSFSQGLAADQTDSHLTTTIAIQPGNATSITNLLFNETGDYTLLGTTTANVSLFSPVQLRLTNSNGLNLIVNTALVYSVLTDGGNTFVQTVPSSNPTFSLPQQTRLGNLCGPVGRRYWQFPTEPGLFQFHSRHPDLSVPGRQPGHIEHRRRQRQGGKEIFRNHGRYQSRS